MEGGGEGDSSIFLVLDVTVNNYFWPASIWGELEMISWSLSVTFGVQTRVIEYLTWQSEAPAMSSSV